ncbi:MAG: type III secretion system export apparatus subunit SctS [Pseudomonadales bacterium]
MDAQAIQFTKEALWLVLVLSAPPIVAATAVGLFVAILQAVTQIQEQTVQYLFKFVAVVLTLFLTASLLGGSLYHFSNRLFLDFPGLIR